MWWLGSPDRAIEHRERAFSAYRAAGDTAAAAEIAVWLAREHLSVYANDAVANGWLARAKRLVGDAPTSARGRLDLALAKREQDPAAREELAERALAARARTWETPIWRSPHWPSWGWWGYSSAASTTVWIVWTRRWPPRRGTAPALLETVAEACCSLVAACDITSDAGRLRPQWARIVTGFIERRADLPLLGFCRTCNAQMLAASGRYEEAERELVTSASELRSDGHRSRCVDPAVKLAEVRLRQGRFEEAASLLDGREGLPEATLPAAQLHLARGDTSLTISVLLRQAATTSGATGCSAGPLLSRSGRGASRCRGHQRGSRRGGRPRAHLDRGRTSVDGRVRAAGPRAGGGGSERAGHR